MKQFFLAVAASTLALAGCGQPIANDQTSGTSAIDEGQVLPGETGDELANAGPGVIVDGVATDGRGTMTSTASEDGVNTTNIAGLDVEPPRNAQDYLVQAAASDQYEIEASQYLLEKSKNAAVRAFAQQMVEDHRAAAQKLQAAARRANLQMPAAGLPADQQTQMTELRAAGNAGAVNSTIDQVFISQQRGAHAKAIALHRGVSNSTAMPDPIRAHARESLIIVQGHDRMLRSLNPANG
jgi:putative membrane protein